MILFFIVANFAAFAWMLILAWHGLTWLWLWFGFPVSIFFVWTVKMALSLALLHLESFTFFWTFAEVSVVSSEIFSFVVFLLHSDGFWIPNYIKIWRLDSNIESKSSNNTYLNIIKIFNKLFKKLNIIESQNLIITST